MTHDEHAFAQPQDTPKPQRVYSRAGNWTAFCLLFILTAFALKTGGFGGLIHSMVLFFTGQVSELRAQPDGFIRMLSQAAAAVVMGIPVSMTAARIAQKIHPIVGGHMLEPTGVPRWFLKPGFVFYRVFWQVAKEEVTARWIFLGLLPMIPFLGGSIAFYVLFLIGNGYWALQHLGNFKDKRDRVPIMVLPQFVGGIFDTLIFVQFGFFAAVLSHLAFDLVLFSTARLNRFNAGEKLLLIYHIVVAGIASVALVVVHKPVSAALQWAHSTGNFSLDGWSSWDYLWLMLLFYAVLNIIGELMLFDEEPIDVGRIGLWGRAIGSVLFMLIIYGVYQLLNWVVGGDGPRLVLMVALLLMFMNLAISGSGVAKNFWIGVPIAALEICVLLGAGFWQGCVVLFVLSLVSTVDRAIRLADRQMELAAFMRGFLNRPA